jgi:ABC-type nitrate/sulfonate/bicarbonate transport system permease component
MKKLILTISGLVSWLIVAELRLVSPVILPSPIQVARAFRTAILYGAAATTPRAIAGLGLGVLIAYLIHFLCVYLKIEKGMDAQFAGARAVPVFAVLPLFVIWFGFSEVGRLLVVTLSAVAFFIAPLHEAYRRLGREWTLLRDQHAMSVGRFYIQIVIPGTVGSLLGALRVTFAVAFTISIASEYIGAQVGIGRFLESARVTFNVPAIFLAVLVASTIGVLLDRGITVLYDRTIHWAGKDGKA